MQIMDTNNNSNNIKIKYQKLYKRTPLNLKIAFLTIVVGLVTWAFLDYTQTHRINKLFNDQLIEKLNKQALEDRLSFDSSINSYNDSVRLFVAQKKFGDYVESQNWSEKDSFDIKYLNRPPRWFPKRSLLKTFIHPRYALMLDSDGKTREVYQNRPAILPLSLLEPTPLLIEKSHNQCLITSIDDALYLVTAESYFDSRRNLLATLIITSPIDDEFLNNSLGVLTTEHLVALMTPGEDSRIITSSDPERLPVGEEIEALQQRFLVTGKEFFDYGASEIQTKFTSFVSKEEVLLLSKSVILKARQERALTALAFILTFAFVMYWITHRIQVLTERITAFSQQTLGIEHQKERKGDQLQILEESFQRLADELKISEAQLIQSEKLSAMGQLAAGLAHELNSPLAGLLPMTEFYREQTEKDSKDHENMTLMLNACNHMAKIVRDFSAFSRESRGTFTGLYINKSIEEILSFSSGHLIKKGIRLTKNYAEDLPKVYGKKTELQQVYLNIINNARDAMPDGGDLIIRTGVSKDKKKVLIEFTDNGIGIKKEHYDKIFDPFFTSKKEVKGVGLGLSVSYGIIKNHNGTITVETEYMKGTKFTVLLPTQKTQEGDNEKLQDITG